MATDATGTPTSPDNIPTFNTAVDAPSGLGSNAQMAAIQTALNNRIGTPAGISTGEGVVWNGTTWVRSSVTPLSASGIGTGIIKTPYRKNSTQQVINTVTETDLLNGEITLAANTIGLTGVLRLTATGDLQNSSGATQAGARFKLKLGGNVLIDTGALAGIWSNSASRFPWKLEAMISNLGATNSQWNSFDYWASHAVATTTNSLLTAGNGIYGAFISTSDVRARGSSASAIDTTAPLALALTVINPVANASLDVTLKTAVVEIL